MQTNHVKSDEFQLVGVCLFLAVFLRCSYIHSACIWLRKLQILFEVKMYKK